MSDSTLSLDDIVRDFASAMKTVDSTRPVARSARSEREYRPGLGPFGESETINRVMLELRDKHPERYSRSALEVKYPLLPRNRCDMCIGTEPDWDWAIEVKMLRMMGDNGRSNDNMLMHILSPYPEHRSALTDCKKLRATGLAGRKAILIYAYDYSGFPVEPAISAFEKLAELELAHRASACAENLVHPYTARLLFSDGN